MKTYTVGITTTFDGSVEIEADSVEDAIEKAKELLWHGQINTLEFEPFTEVHYAEEV